MMIAEHEVEFGALHEAWCNFIAVSSVKLTPHMNSK